MRTDKKTILILIDWYLPGRKAGGPVKSIESLIWALHDKFNFKIITSNRDLGETEPYKGLKTDEWLPGESGSEILYTDIRYINAEKLAAIINSVTHDFLYINSFYSKWFSIVPLKLKQKKKIGSRIILAPRGMLSAGALALKSFKKKTFIAFSRISGLHKNITWHATYGQEVQEIKKYFPDAIIKLCPNFSRPVVVETPGVKKNKGQVRLFYLSRVSEVKNLHVALESLKLVEEGAIEFDIYGATDNKQYFQGCEAIAKSLPGNIHVTFKGELKSSHIGKVIPAYHFLFLPTSNENFGHSIMESLQCGCPVIISDKTPWRSLQQFNCGWDAEISTTGYAKLLERVVGMEDEEYTSMSDAAKKYASVQLNVEGNKKLALQLFN